MWRVEVRLLLLILMMARRHRSFARMPRGRAIFAHRGAVIQFLLVDPSIHLLARVDVRLALEGRTIGHPITKPQNNGALVGDDM